MKLCNIKALPLLRITDVGGRIHTDPELLTGVSQLPPTETRTRDLEGFLSCEP